MVSNDGKYAIGKNLLMAIVTAVSLFSAVIFLSNSWIKIMTIGLIVVMGIVWLVSHGLLRRTLKYALFAVMIFSISFSAFEGYLFWNAGYPPTFGNSQPDITLSYPNILDASLTEVVQSAENTLAFKLFMLEHPKKVCIQAITLDTGLFRGGRIEVEFSNIIFSHWGNGIRFIAVDGEAYHARVTSYALATLYFSSAQMYPQSQIQTPADEAIQQIDSLGFRWYYNCIMEDYQNKMGVVPEINALQISFQWESGINYEGYALLMIGSYENNNQSRGVFFASFQPDGTLNYINTTN
ncbi:MAG: hypothetical protein LBC03_02445 [Nitrososphaerota archaeon]|nr:hypothetical protein [Nitrososphaerota archaeon]